MKEPNVDDANAKKVFATYENTLIISSAGFNKRYTDAMGGYLYDIDRLIIQYRTPKDDLIDVWELQSSCTEDEDVGYTKEETYTVEEFKNGRWSYRYKPLEKS